MPCNATNLSTTQACYFFFRLSVTSAMFFSIAEHLALKVYLIATLGLIVVAAACFALFSCRSREGGEAAGGKGDLSEGLLAAEAE